MTDEEQAPAKEDKAKPRAARGTNASDPVGRAATTLRTSLPQYLLLGKARPPGQKRPYEAGATLSEYRAAAHDKAVADIAGERFGFPTERYRDFKTYTNVPDRTMGVAMDDAQVAYPDIVVVKSPENQAKIIGEVETAETVNDTTARTRWAPFADLAPLYLYVPVGQADLAQKLCKRWGADVVGIRTWRYAVGLEEIEISDHFTVPSGPEELLPGVLRPGK
jgi:hypothetical protein